MAEAGTAQSGLNQAQNQERTHRRDQQAKQP
jgi:hypothetical protein